MVEALDRLSHQPKNYAQLCACLLGHSVGSILSIDDPSAP
jgi:hypothetical protein